MTRTVALAIALFAAASSLAATRTWSGSVDALWSNPANWEEGIVPANGDALVFPPLSRTASNNDLSTDSITFQSLTLNLDWVNITGNALPLAAGVTVGEGVTILLVQAPVVMYGTQAIDCGAAFCQFRDLRWEGLVSYARTLSTPRSAAFTLRGYGTFRQTSGIGNYSTLPGMDGALTVEGGHASGGGPGLDLYLGGTCVFAHCTALLESTPSRAVIANGGILRPRLRNYDERYGRIFLGSESILSIRLVPNPVPLMAAAASTEPGANGTVTIDNARLVLEAPLFRYAPGFAFTIIRPTAGSPVNGTFAGLSDGATLKAHNRQRFRLNYSLDGDVRVTALSKIDVPHDLDNDGKSDIFWRHATTGENYRWSMDSYSVLSTGPINTVDDANWKIAALADFDGDGDSDVLWRHAVSGENYMYLMENGGIFSGGLVNQISDLTWAIAASGDVNGDGKFDIIWHNSATGDVYIYLMDGRAILMAGPVRAVAPGWKIAVAGDFDFDGDSDIVFQNADTGEIWTWLMSGFTVVSEGHTDMRPDATIVGVGQFNQYSFDGGLDDLLLRNNETGALETYAMWGVDAYRKITITHVEDLNWEVVGTGDYNGDLYNDVLWRHAVTGENYLYLVTPEISNSVTFTGHELPTIPDPNWKIVR